MSEKQGPPNELPATRVVGEYIESNFPAVHIGAQPKPGKHPIGGGFSVPPTRAGGMGSGITFNEGQRRQTRDNIKAATQSIKNEYEADLQGLARSTEVDLANVRAQYPASGTTPAQAHQHELNIRNILTHQKTVELHEQTVSANTFYGHSPLNSSIGDFLARAQHYEKLVVPYGRAYKTWANSYKAAYSAKLLTEQIQLLNAQQAHVQNLLAAAQAQEHQQREAEEEAVRRVEAEQARVSAEKEAQRVAAEEERIKVEAEAPSQSPTLANVGSTAAFGPTFTGTTGTIGVSPATLLALKAALRAAISAATAALTAAAAPVLVGFTALLAPSRLSNGDLYSVSVPLAELAPDLKGNLYELAATGRQINLPVRLGSRTIGNRVEIFVVAADGMTIPTSVPVKLAHFDARKNVYLSGSSDANGPLITWTPLVKPQNPSTVFPATETDLSIYEGATITLNEGRIDTSPLLDGYGFDGFITVFPAESGIPPLYVVFNNPYEGAIVKGKYSERYFNPKQAGGPILDLDWRKAVITQAGIEAVKLHISRLDQSDANDVMVQRLEKILHGYWVLTDADLRYYTHEIRELERFRALGISDDFKPENGSPVWNNTHTATLEDYKLSSDDTMLYSPDAINAGNKQINRIYEQMLKGKYE